MKILLLDKREIFREGLARVLNDQPGMRVVGTCASVSECIEKARQLQPDVTIIDTELEEQGAIRTTSQLHELMPDTGVLILTHSESERDLLGTIKAGARGYITKDSSLSDLVKAINIIADGGILISPPMASKMLQEFSSLETTKKARIEEDKWKLSNREREVLSLLADGANNKTIAESLLITENTVKVHLRNIMEKLHVQTRLQAALMAKGKGLGEQIVNKGEP